MQEVKNPTIETMSGSFEFVKFALKFS